VTRIAGPKLRLLPKPAETFALAVHELATNAVKYGALASDAGRIEVIWTVEDGEDTPQLLFSWTETGLKRPATAPSRRGFGSELIERTLAYELGASAELRFEPSGIQCTIALPLTKKLVLPKKRS
jgi:two-component system CheB/CheR fusion protein